MDSRATLFPAEKILIIIFLEEKSLKNGNISGRKNIIPSKKIRIMMTKLLSSMINDYDDPLNHSPFISCCIGNFLIKRYTHHENNFFQKTTQVFKHVRFYSFFKIIIFSIRYDVFLTIFHHPFLKYNISTCHLYFSWFFGLVFRRNIDSTIIIIRSS